MPERLFEIVKIQHCGFVNSKRKYQVSSHKMKFFFQNSIVYTPRPALCSMYLPTIAPYSIIKAEFVMKQ